MSKLNISNGHSAVGRYLVILSRVGCQLWWRVSGPAPAAGKVLSSPAQQQLTVGWSQALLAAATSPMPPTSICTHLCSLYLTIAVFCSLCLPATEFPYQELTPKCLGHGKKFAWKPSNDITIIEHIVQIWHRFLFRRFLFNGQEEKEKISQIFRIMVHPILISVQTTVEFKLKCWIETQMYLLFLSIPS